MGKYRRIIALVLSIFIIMVTGCNKPLKENINNSLMNTGKSDSNLADLVEGNNTKSLLPISKEPVTLTVWSLVYHSTNKYIRDLGEGEFYKEMAQRTNITLKFTHPPFSQALDQFNLMIASGEYPDLIEGVAGFYAGGGDKAIKDGVVLRLNELINKYAPNYNKIRNLTEEIRKQTITDEGNIYVFSMIDQTSAEGPWYGPTIRKDWLDELGINIPITYDDWYSMLKQFKEKKNADMPMLLGSGGLPGFYSFVGGFGFAYDFFQVENKIKYAILEPGFKEYLIMMNKWYSEGLIDRDFISVSTFDDEINRIASGRTGAFFTPSAIWKVLKNLSKDPKYELTAAPNPVKRIGDKVHVRESNTVTGAGAGFSVSTSCKYPELAVKYLDYCYSDEMTIRANYGIEGKTYTMVDGKPRLTEFMTNNPDGKTLIETESIYGLFNGPYHKDWTRNYTGYTPKQMEATSIWAQADDSYIIPPTTLTSEEAKKYTAIMSEIYSYTGDMLIKFIMGLEPLSNYDEFIEKIRAMRIEEAIKYRQAALNRYLTRK